MTVSIANEWANSYGQGTTFTSITSALQSCVVPLTEAYSVGGGSGTPTAGNWLFTIASWTQDPAIINVHVGVSDDIHSWWRQYPASGPNGNVRTTIAYTPNIARATGNVYVAPDMEIAAINVLVVEVAGLGPWVTLLGPDVNYAAAAESIALALAAGASSTFFIGAVGGDSTAATQAFAPSGWTGLHTLSQTNGSNHLADNELTSAYIVSGSNQSVTGTAGCATDLSGFLLGVLVTGTDPIPATQNPNWPYVKFEAAFGAGFNTPNSEITTGSNTNPLNWVDLTSRLWSFDETTGIQYQLGELQATDLEMELDNVDGYLSPLNVGSPYYSNAMNANMSFQSGISPWTGTHATVAQSTAQTYASAPGAIATYSMQVNNAGAFTAPSALSELVAVTGSAYYTGSAWVYSATAWTSGVQVGFNWYNTASTFISSTGFPAATSLSAATWTQYASTPVTAPSSAAYGQLAVTIASTPATSHAFYVNEAGMVPGQSTVLTGLVSPGTPIRLRAALGTIGGETVNRWYVIQRNAAEWNEQIDDAYRRYCAVTGTDLWAALSSVPPTFYRSEVYEDAPYAWWPMDDQPLSFGILPTTLLNAATGNTNVLDIVVSANGAAFQQTYNTDGGETGGGVPPQGGQENNIQVEIPPGVAVYSVGAAEGWMFGDPQGTAPTLDSGNPVTSNPGSAAWVASGQSGDSGEYGWYLICNDTGFPPLSGGITVEIWFNYLFYASGQGFETSDVGFGNFSPQTQQPYDIPLTILELATSSEPVAILQLDTSGHLSFITYDGATPTSNSIYTSSDLRSNSWHLITVTTTTTAWQVWLDGGANANVTGTATGMTSAWTYVIVNCDFGSDGGSTPAGITHGGNAAFAHLAVYPYKLPYYRIMDHYWSAITAFGQMPTPTSCAVSWSSNPVTMDDVTTGAFAPDGTDEGNYETADGVAMSARVAAIAPGSVTSGASAWASASTENITVAIGYGSGKSTPWVGWNGVAPQFAVYTAENPGTETEASIVNGSGDSYESDYGSSATGAGVCHVSSGDGSDPPSTPTAIGDTVGQRIERLLRGGRCTSPQRSIDPAPLLVQAPGTQGGGIQVGSSIQEIQQSDNGFLCIDNVGNLVYWQRPHLAAQYSSPVWQIGPTTAAGRIPYYPAGIKWIADPQRIWNAVTIAPFSPSGAELPLVVPQDAAAVLASQIKYGAQPLQVISWLQSLTEMQNQANFLFSFFGVPQRRVEGVKIDAAPYPAAWNLVMGINVGDIVQVEDWVIGGGGDVYTYRITEIERHLSFGSHDDEVTATVKLTCDAEPAAYWS